MFGVLVGIMNEEIFFVLLLDVLVMIINILVLLVLEINILLLFK